MPLQLKAIKNSYVCRFTKDCSGCSMKNFCVSASSVSSGLRKYLFKIRGYREPKTQSMIDGQAKHDEWQKGMKELTKTPHHIFRKELLSGREIVYKELQMCSPFHGLRGLIDVIKLQYDQKNKTMNILATELKSSFWKPYLFQMAVYGMILSDLKFRRVQEVTKRKTKRITAIFYPNEEFHLNITLRLQVFGQKKPMEVPWVINGVMTEWGNNMSAAVQRKLKEKRKVHGLGIEWAEEIPMCQHCNPEFCSFYDRFCSKMDNYEGNPKTKQRYFGKNKLLVKSKPSINLAELKGMVKIK